MCFNFKGNLGFYEWLKNLFFFSVILSSCTIVKHYQKQKPILINSTVTLKGGNFTNDERIAIKQRLLGQLDDSSRTTVKDVIFLVHIIDHPPAYDSVYSTVSANNMKGSMLHLGYYNSKASFKADTSNGWLSMKFLHLHLGKQQRVYTHYTVETGPPTLIDTVAYDLDRPELQALALQYKDKSFLVVGKPISKTAVSNEMSRLVELFRSNGYYKFTSDDLKLIGDTSFAILTNTSDDPFENLKLLAQANEKRDRPTIKLEMILNPATDSSRLKKFYINDVFVYPDLRAKDVLTDTAFIEKDYNGYIFRYHSKVFKNSFLLRNIYLKKGDIYDIANYNKTLNNLSKLGVWQGVNIDIEEPKDSVGKVNMIIQLLPLKKNAFETSLETSYSTNSATNVASLATTGNLLGIDGTISLEKRNIGKEAIKMTNTIHGGVELNLNQISPSNDIVNSNEFGFTNTISIPRIVFPRNFLKNIDSLVRKANLDTKQSFINTDLSYVDRIDLFDQQTLTFALGWQWSTSTTNRSRNYIVKPLNIEFSYLYNESTTFIDTLNNNPYLKYSFNTALVLGTSFGYSSAWTNPVHLNRQRNFKLNVEESGYPVFIPLGPLGILRNYIRQYLKTDVEYTYNVSYPKSSVVFHLFGGIGIPLSNDSNDITLPFFKQYYSGGSNSMRGWPIRGIGVGGQAMIPYDSVSFNDRTGDIKLEGNFEYRYNILQIIPNSLMLKGALFIDAGNIWDFKIPDPSKPSDDANLGHFDISNVYKQLGVDIGTGFRFDFNYFLLRFDMGFRVKQPDVIDNAGWQLPDITFNNLFKRGVTDPVTGVNDDRYRIWRYENFNFSIGIGMPF
jgi:outer membrane protein insertion porin family